MSYAQEQALGATVGARADAELATLRQNVDETQAALDDASRSLTATRAQLATATADRDRALADLEAAQQAGGSSSDLAALVALVNAAQAAGGTPTPGPAGQPTVTGAKIGAPGVGTLNQLNATSPKGTQLVLPPGRYSVRDFRAPVNSPTFAHFLHNFGGVHGSGQDKSTITVEPGSLDFTNTTDAEKKLRPTTDSIPEPGTNPYNLVRFDAATVVEDVTILGTPQGIDPRTGVERSYHGVMFYGTQDPTLRRVTVRHVPGSRGVPPDETFPVYFYRVKGTITLEDVLLDGDGVASSGVSGQPAEGVPLAVLLNRVRTIGGPNGAGWTCFNRAFSSIRLVDHHTDGSLVGANFEQCVVNGGNQAGQLKAGEGIVIVRPDYRNPSGYRDGQPTWKRAYWHLSVDSSAAGGTNGKSVPGVSNRIDVYDPVLPAGQRFKVCISDGYGYENVPKGAQAQRGSDVHVWTGGAWIGDPADPTSRYVGGVERPELIEFSRSGGAGLGG